MNHLPIDHTIQVRCARCYGPVMKSDLVIQGSHGKTYDDITSDNYQEEIIDCRIKNCTRCRYMNDDIEKNIVSYELADRLWFKSDLAEKYYKCSAVMHEMKDVRGEYKYLALSEMASAEMNHFEMQYLCCIKMIDLYENFKGVCDFENMHIKKHSKIEELAGVHQVEKKCAACQKLVSVKQMDNMTVKINGQYHDFDMRPLEPYRSTMNFWLEECPHCGYIHKDISHHNKIVEDFMKTTEYIKLDSEYMLSVCSTATEKRFCKYSLIMGALGDLNSAYEYALYSAWVCDDIKEDDRARTYRVRLSEIFDQMDIHNPDELTMLRHMDVLRRSGLSQKLFDFCEKYEHHNRKCRITAVLQIILATSKNTLVKDFKGIFLD